jgi:hypothetical protein
MSTLEHAIDIMRKVNLKSKEDRLRRSVKFLVKPPTETDTHTRRTATCNAITMSGNRCKHASVKNGFCKQHEGSATAYF